MNKPFLSVSLGAPVPSREIALAPKKAIFLAPLADAPRAVDEALARRVDRVIAEAMARFEAHKVSVRG